MAPQIDETGFKIALSRFLNRFPRGFQDTEYQEQERNYKNELSRRMRSDLGRDVFNDLLSKQAYDDIFQRASAIVAKKANLLSHYEMGALLNYIPAIEGALGRFAQALFDFLYGKDPFFRRFDAFVAFLDWVDAEKVNIPKLARLKIKVATWPITTCFPYLADPKDQIFLKPEPTREFAKRLGYDLPYNRQPDWRHYEAFREFALKLKVMLEQEGHPTADMIDIQSFIWCVAKDNQMDDKAPPEPKDAISSAKPEPTNLIFFGPPGTGKTYATRKQAVGLCDGFDSASETEEIAARYQELFSAGQIRFVTFHQSFSYEEFVEGLRPETNDGENESGGFRLVPKEGIFREIAAAAKESLDNPGDQNDKPPIDLTGKHFFKISLGCTGFEDDVYEAAINDICIGLNWAWDTSFADIQGKTLSEYHKFWDKIISDRRSNVRGMSQMWTFLNEMRIGDIVILSEGNSKFRAIGEITGEYTYNDESSTTCFYHSRNVKWLKVLKESLPISEIWEKDFSQVSCYTLRRDNLKIGALTRLLSEGAPKSEKGVAPAQYVLIIDEINRANISKVFGELITLLEPDKRLGMENQLTVRLPYSRDEFGVPPNLHIIGTMNTADRSIALLDTALRRRFLFKEIGPDADLLRVIDLGGVSLRLVFETMNDRIEYFFDRDHRIGHAFFMGCENRSDVDWVIRDKIIPLLAEYFYEDWGKIARVLGEPETGGLFLQRRMLNPPPRIEGEMLETWRVLPDFHSDCYKIGFGDGAQNAS